MIEKRRENLFYGVFVPQGGYVDVYADLRTNMKYKGLDLDLTFSRYGITYDVENFDTPYATLSINEKDREFVRRTSEHEMAVLHRERGKIRIPKRLR